MPEPFNDLQKKRQNMLKYATYYSEKGFSVVPIDAQSKRPIMAFKDKPRLRTDDIKEIWKDHPDAAIGLKTEDFFVIDIDRHKEGADGFKSLTEFIESQAKYTEKDLLPETLTQTTAGGGAQYFYFKRDDRPIYKQNIGWLPGVDVKSNKDNYVVVPPTEREFKKEDGSLFFRAYEWQQEDGKVSTMIKAPAILIDYINNSSKGSNSSTIEHGNFINAGLPKYWNSSKKKGDKRNLINALNQVANGIGNHGERNVTFTKFVGTLLANDIDVNTAWKLTQMANNNTAEPLPIKEITTIFNSILEAENRKREKEINKLNKGDA